MDRTLSFKDESEDTLQHCTSSTLKRSRSLHNPRKQFSAFSFWVSKSLKNLSHKAKLPNGVGSKRFVFSGKVIYNSVYCASPWILENKMEPFVAKNEEIEGKTESFIDKNEEMEKKMEYFGENAVNSETFMNENQEYGESSESSEFLASEVAVNEEQSSISDDSSSTPLMVWPIMMDGDVSEEVEKPHLDNRKLEKQGSSLTEIEMMKERFAKLLLGEDMSGSGNGVCTALAISNAITNLCATLFGQIWRLEPLPVEKKLMWRREMEWLLCVSDHIVELIPSWQTFPDGSKLEVMTSRPRSDLYVNLPALRKLDHMLLEILDSFQNTEFWYVDQGILDPEGDGSSSFRNPLPRQEEKWWLPVPRMPICGLSEIARNDLQHRRECTNQILKATMAINSNTLAEMDVPQSYLDALPKNAKASLGDIIHRYINSDKFSSECLLDCLDLSSEHQALEIANRVEASMHIWRRRTHSNPLNITNRSNSKSSWEMVKDLVTDADKREQLGDRAESLLLRLKQRFPGLPQTTLDMSKIQYNKDVGKSILESYSRVLESLAFNIVARIDDLLYVDDLTKHSDQSVTLAKVGVIAHKSVGIPLSVPVPGTPYRTAFTTPNFSPAPRISPAKVDRTQFLENSKNTHRGFGVKKILTDYLMSDPKVKDISSGISRSESLSSTNGEISASQSGRLSESSKEAVGTPKRETQEEEQIPKLTV